MTELCRKDDPIYALFNRDGLLWGFRYTLAGAQGVAECHDGMTVERLVPVSKLHTAEQERDDYRAIAESRERALMEVQDERNEARCRLGAAYDLLDAVEDTYPHEDSCPWVVNDGECDCSFAEFKRKYKAVVVEGRAPTKCCPGRPAGHDGLCSAVPIMPDDAVVDEEPSLVERQLSALG